LNKGEKHLKITCDNAGGQNKNNVTIWFYLYLVICGYYKSTSISLWLHMGKMLTFVLVVKRWNWGSIVAERIGAVSTNTQTWKVPFIHKTMRTSTKTEVPFIHKRRSEH
jgi:hypothetical protein